MTLRIVRFLAMVIALSLVVEKLGETVMAVSRSFNRWRFAIAGKLFA
jgi:hypothetical protein